MKIIVAGGRNIRDYEVVKSAIEESGFKITEIVSGHCYGVDELGEKYARENRLPCTLFPAKWNLYGKSAGPIRNKEMAEYADALIAIYDGVSRGTASMIRLAREAGLKIFIKTLTDTGGLV